MHVLLIFLTILQGSFSKSGTAASSYPFCTAPLAESAPLQAVLGWEVCCAHGDAVVLPVGHTIF